MSSEKTDGLQYKLYPSVPTFNQCQLPETSGMAAVMGIFMFAYVTVFISVHILVHDDNLKNIA